MMNKFNPTHII